MEISSHSKCKKCGEAQHVQQLKDNPDGNGMICKDESECKVRLTKAIKKQQQDHHAKYDAK